MTNSKKLALLLTLCLTACLCAAVLAGCKNSGTDAGTDPDTVPAGTPASEAPADTPAPDTQAPAESATEALTEAQTEVPTEPATEAAVWSPEVIVWYDVDNGSSCNTRPDNGWWYPYSESPGITTVGGLFRAATPLLGTYDQRDISTARQHLYWLAQAGFTAVSVDVTNVGSINDSSNPDMQFYYKGVYDNVEVLFAAAKSLADEGMTNVPKIYVNVRLFGEDYDGLATVISEYKSIYEKYPAQAYHLAGSDKPFIGVFADWSLFDSWGTSPKTDAVDSSFDFRWTNGYLARYGKNDGTGALAIDAARLLWPFVENAKATAEGSYKAIYTADADGKPAVMVASVSVHGGWNEDGSGWDALNHLVDGKSPLERTLAPVYKYQPSIVIIDRFNYPLVWLEQAQEGLGLYHSGHFEPCEELGFDMLYAVTRQVYTMRGLTGEMPAAVTSGTCADGYLMPDLPVLPSEYRIGTTADLSGAAWCMMSLESGIDYRVFTGTDTLYVQTRNAFGESEVTAVKVSPLADAAAPFAFEFEAHGDESKYTKSGNAWVRGGDFTDWMPDDTSGGASLFCSMHVDNTDNPDSAISAKLTVPTGGTYSVSLSYFLNNSSPVVQLYLDGEPLGGETDFFHGGGLTRADADLGTVTLTPGEHTLTVRSASTNSGKWEIWLDVLQFTPVS